MHILRCFRLQIKPFVTMCRFRIGCVGLGILACLHLGCSAEDGQDGIRGRDCKDGTDGVIGQDGNANVLVTQWFEVKPEDWGPRTEAVPEITQQLVVGGLTPEQLESMAIYSYIRFSATDTLKLALPALLRATPPDLVDHEVVLQGVATNSIVFGIRTKDGSEIPIDAVFVPMDIKFILIPANIDASGMEIKEFLKHTPL